MPVDKYDHSKRNSSSSNENGNNGNNGNNGSTRSKNNINIDRVKEQIQKSDFNDDESRYRIATQIASENLSDKDNVTKEQYRDEIDKVYSQLGSGNKGEDVRNGNPFFGLVGGLKDLINGINHGIASGIDGLYDMSIGEWTNSKDMFNADDVETVVDILGDIALTASNPFGWAMALGKNAIQNSDALYEGVTGKDAITGTDIDAGARAAGLAQGIGGTALAALPGFGKAAAKSGSKAFLKAMDGAADDIAKAAAKETTKEGAEAAAAGAALDSAKKVGFFDAIKQVRGAGKNAAEKVKEFRPIDVENASFDDVMKHTKDVKEARQKAMKRTAKKVKEDMGINVPTTLKELPTTIKDAAKSKANDTLESIKSIPSKIENIPNQISTEVIPRTRARWNSSIVRHPFDKEARATYKNYTNNHLPKDLQDLANNESRHLLNKEVKAMEKAKKAAENATDAEDAARKIEKATKGEKAGNILKEGVKGSLRNIVGPGAGAMFTLSALDSLDDTDSNYIAGVTPAILGALMSRGKRAKIGLRGLPNGSIQQFARSANAAARDRRRDLKETGLARSGTYSEDQILNALRRGR